ncbi:hypothetical protein ABIE27_001907 [Paenibacillus sp. 4624]
MSRIFRKTGQLHPRKVMEGNNEEQRCLYACVPFEKNDFFKISNIPSQRAYRVPYNVVRIKRGRKEEVILHFGLFGVVCLVVCLIVFKCLRLKRQNLFAIRSFHLQRWGNKPSFFFAQTKNSYTKCRFGNVVFRKQCTNILTDGLTDSLTRGD